MEFYPFVLEMYIYMEFYPFVLEMYIYMEFNVKLYKKMFVLLKYNMTVHNCPRCGYNSKLKGDLRRHYIRKRPCVITHKNISQEDCLKLLEDPSLEISEIGHLKQQVEKQQKQIEDLIDALKNYQGNANCNNNNTNTNTNTNSHNNINNVINIHSYKDTDYTVLEKALNSCIKTNGDIDIGKLMEKVHFNSKFPQNHNVYISNSKTRRVMKYDGEKFIEDGMGNTGLEKVFNEKLADIEEHQDLNDDIKIAAEETWMQYNDKDTIQRKEVLEAIYKPLYNKRDIVNKNLIET
jgi:hypothetical protein